FANFRRNWRSANTDGQLERVVSVRMGSAEEGSLHDGEEKTTASTMVKSIRIDEEDEARERSDSLLQYTFRALPPLLARRMKFERMNSEVAAVVVEPNEESTSGFCDICRSDCIKYKYARLCDFLTL